MAVDLPLTSPEEAARYRSMGLWRDETLAARFFRMADRFPDKVAIIDGDRRFTYREVRTLVDNIGGNLLDLGVPKGEVVALQTKNSAEFAIVHLAVHRIGRLYMPMHDTWREHEIRHLLGRAKARVLIVPGIYRDFDYAAMIDGLRGELPHLQAVYSLDGARGGCRDYAELTRPTRRDTASLDRELPDPDLPAHIMLSGGTTSLSKISRFSSNDLLVMLDNVGRSIDLSDKDVAAAIAPGGTGATGYVFPMLEPLLYGATSVVLPRWSDPEEAIDLIVQHRCTYAVGIPTQLTRMIPGLEKRRKEDFASFNVFVNTGAPIPYETALRIERLMNCRTQTMYGATDGGVPVMTTIHDPTEKRLGTSGRRVPGVECELRDAEGRRLPDTEPGEVVWRGADKSYGYLGDEEATRAAFTPDRFYKSGDLGQFDPDGYLMIVGRVKDMILRGGRNISPRTVEELMAKHPAVLEISVAAMPDPELGERACAFVTTRPGASLTFEEMVEFLKAEKLAIWQLPERLEIMDEMPKSPGGKIAKGQLTAMITQKLKQEGKRPT